MFQGRHELFRFAKYCTGTASIFTAAIVLQFGFLLKDYQPRHLLTPIFVGLVLSILIGHLGVLRLRIENNMRTKSLLTSRLGHEFRTPLNTIMGFAQILRASESPHLNAQQQEQLNEILVACRHMQQLISDIIEHERLEQGRLDLHLTSCHALTIAAECHPLIAPLARKRQIYVDLMPAHGNDPAIIADPLCLKQVLIYLLTNAVDASPKGGQVRLHAHYTPDSYMRISIIDNGPDIAPTLHADIFEPFGRHMLESDHEYSSGIGLSIARDFVQLMHGRIGIKANPDGGTIFWLELPLAQGNAI